MRRWIVAAAAAVLSSAMVPSADAVGGGAGTFVATLRTPAPAFGPDNCPWIDPPMQVEAVAFIGFANEQAHYEGSLDVSATGSGAFCHGIGGRFMGTAAASGTDASGRALVCPALTVFSVQAVWMTMYFNPADEVEHPCTLDGRRLDGFGFFFIGDVTPGVPTLDGSRTHVSTGGVAVSAW